MKILEVPRIATKNGHIQTYESFEQFSFIKKATEKLCTSQALILPPGGWEGGNGSPGVSGRAIYGGARTGIEPAASHDR